MIKVTDINTNSTSKNITMSVDIEGTPAVVTFTVIEFSWCSYVEGISISSREVIKSSIKKKIRDYIKSTFERVITIG